MLENSVWKQYHDEKSIHDALVALYDVDAHSVTHDESFLYAALKRRLTKKELRGFIMKEAGSDVDAIGKQLSLDGDAVETLLRKAYRKIRQNEMRNEVTLSSDTLNNHDKKED